MSFLEVNIIREQGKSTTLVYRKPTFSGIYTHFDIYSDWIKFHFELVKLMDVFKNNGYPENLSITVLKRFWKTNIKYISFLQAATPL